MSSNLIRADHRHHFVANIHFGHVGILDVAIRPYADIRAHDRDLVKHKIPQGLRTKPSAKTTQATQDPKNMMSATRPVGGSPVIA